MVRDVVAARLHLISYFSTRVLDTSEYVVGGGILLKKHNFLSQPLEQIAQM